MQNQDLFNKYCLLNTTPTGKQSLCRKPFMNFYWKYILSILHYCTYIYSFPSFHMLCNIHMDPIWEGGFLYSAGFSTQLMSILVCKLSSKVFFTVFRLKELFLAGKCYVFFSCLHRFLFSRRKGLVGPIHLW